MKTIIMSKSSILNNYNYYIHTNSVLAVNMVGGTRTLNDFSISPKLITVTNFVTTILDINKPEIKVVLILILEICIFNLMVKYRFSESYNMGSNPIRCYNN
jgi:hypothetical protein